MSAVEIFTSKDGRIELNVSLDRDTVWLTQAQMAELFDSSIDNVSLHLKNIYKECELTEEATIEDYSIVRQEGKRQVRRNIKHYNLDAIISVGYRISSQRATQFRQWATRVLKQHLVEGYSLNERRLVERGIEFQQVLGLLSQTLQHQRLIDETGSAVMAVIEDYARSWSLLQRYDEDSLSENRSAQSTMHSLDVHDAQAGIAELKHTLMAKGEASALFGQPRGDGLASILATLEQGFAETLFYPNVASRAAHLLYLVIKNHPLADGNKRSASFLFLWYLRLNQHLLAKPVEAMINDNTLVALALLIAESDPAHKTLMIRLIEHFIILTSTEEPS